MPRGLPDYYNPASQVSQRMVDLAGVLAAIAKIPPLDGRGRLAFIDTFGEGAYAWPAQTTGDGSAREVVTDRSEIPPVSCRLRSGSLAGGGSSGINHYFKVSYPPEAGIEVGLFLVGHAVLVDLELSYNDEGVQTMAQLRLNSTTGVASINTPTGFVTIATINTTSLSLAWLPIKLVASFGSGKYLRATIGQVQYNLEDYDIPTGGVSNIDNLGPLVIVTAQGPGDNTAYIGHVALTLDEP